MTSLPATARQRGAGSILVLLAIMVLMTALLAATVLVSGHLARRQAAAAADLTALGAAKYLRAHQSGNPLETTVSSHHTAAPCAVADDIATANDAILTDCIVDGMEVEVQVAVPVTALRDWLPEQKRRARAGPTEHH